LKNLRTLHKIFHAIISSQISNFNYQNHTNAEVNIKRYQMRKLIRYSSEFITRSLQLQLQCVSGIWTSLAWLWWFGFRLDPMSGNDQATPKLMLTLKVVKSDTIIIILLPLARLSLNTLWTFHFLYSKEENVKVNWLLSSVG